MTITMKRVAVTEGSDNPTETYPDNVWPRLTVFIGFAVHLIEADKHVMWPRRVSIKTAQQCIIRFLFCNLSKMDAIFIPKETLKMLLRYTVSQKNAPLFTFAITSSDVGRFS